MALWSSIWKHASPALLPRSGAAGRKPGRTPAQRLALDATATGQSCRVVSVRAPEHLPDWGRWLNEIGFLPGERVSVTARSLWGGDPLVVRVGQSTFALRRAEAACIHVETV